MTRPKTPASASCVPAWLQHHREEPQPCLYTRTFISRPTSPPAHTMAATTSELIAQKTQRPASEDLLSEKWDQCLSNLIVKSALGAGFGIVFSVLLFKRRAWPATIGLGFGAGRGYAECDREFKGSSIAKMAGERLQRS